VEKVVPGFENFNERIRIPGGFHLPNPAGLRKWQTPSGRAQFKLLASADCNATPLPLVLTTIRSHDQYNTTIYGMNDRYRGIRGRRDVVFMNEEDMKSRGIQTGDAVTLRTANRVAHGFHAVAYPIAAGSCAAYFPEASVLVALEDFDPQSRTPAYKSTPVEVERLGGDGLPRARE
jgi:anaerobic selenocysteine-containing dehydrogenase